MLNLNYNIIGSNQKFLYRGNGQYVIRNDGFNQYIVLAVPGNLFQDTFGNNQFGMANAYDDISAYVVTGQPNTPSGSNIPMIASGSTVTVGPIYPSSSYKAFPVDTEGRYSASLYLNGKSSLVVNKTWPAKQGANFTFSSSFVIETYAAFATTASAFRPDPSGQPYNWTFAPKRILAWKYVTDPAQGQYLYEMWSGNTPEYSPVTSGSARFVFDITGSSNFTASATESVMYPQYSVPIVPYQFNHYAIAYSSQSLDTNKSIRMYVNGVLIASSSLTGSNYDITSNTSSILQIMGAVAGIDPNYSGSQAFFNDFKIYNGTDKNYTGSSFVPPQSLAYWTGY